MSKSPAYQWYPKDILASQRVACMDARVECWYRRALDFCWVNGTVPSCPKKFAAMVGKGCTSKAAADEIIPMFILHPEDPNLLIHERQEQERAKQEAFARRQSENGKRGGRPRKDGKEKGLGFSGESQNEAKKSSSSPSSISPKGDEVKTPPTPPKKSGSSPKPFLLLTDLKAIVLSDKATAGSFVQTYYRAGLSPEMLSRWLDAFHLQLEHDGEQTKQEKDYRQHFANWIKFQPYTTMDPKDFSPVKAPVNPKTQEPEAVKKRWL